MGRIVTWTILLTLSLAGGSVRASTSGTPALTVLDRSPVVVRGTGFSTRERIVVTVNIGPTRTTKRTAATSRGRFLLRFDGVRLPACTGGVIVATGARGHSARLKLGLRECPGPALEP